ncbi:MAG: extracellular solute-binding protein [Sumerlaeia bacterium]
MRPFLFAVTLAFAAILGAGCGADVLAADDNKITLVVWQGFKFEEVTVMEEITNRFEQKWMEENPGKTLDIILERVSFDDMTTKLKTAALARRTPDIAFVDAQKVIELTYGQTLVPLDTLDNWRYDSIQDARSEFVNASFDQATVFMRDDDDSPLTQHQFGLPVQTTTLALFWNREMFRAKGQELRAAGLDPNRAPKDWDELIAYSKVLEGDDIYGYAMSGSLWFQFPVFNQYNVEWVQYEANGRAVPTVDSALGLAAMERLAGLVLDSQVEAGAWKPGATGPDQGFQNRKYAMIFTGPWNTEKFEANGLDFDISLIPAVPEKEARELGIEPESSSNIGGQSGVIFKTCEHPEIAYEFLEYFTGEVEQRYWAETLGQIPTRLSAWEDLDMSKYPYLPKFMEQLKHAEALPRIPLYGTLESDIFNPEFQLVLSGKKTPEAALESIQAALDKRILEKMNARVRD